MLIQTGTTRRAKWQRVITSLSLMLTAVILLGPLATAVLAKPEEVAVCHLKEDGTYKLLNLPEQALPDHLDHGDLVVGVDVDENCEPLIPDADRDGVADAEDNCINVPNPGQEDNYGSAAGDACEDLDGDGTPDVQEADFCLSIDGVLLVDSGGTATCYSTASTGSGSNIAVANGDGAHAEATNGDNNTATATGANAEARAGNGSNSTATADGDGAEAYARQGNNNTATATGIGAEAQAVFGNNNIATADGDGAFAGAGVGDNNSATATGANAVALAVSGSNNSATSTGVFTCAGEGNDGETAVNENLCG